MSQTVKDKVFNFRTNKELYDKAKEVAAENHLEMAALFNLLLEEIVFTNAIPLKSKEELEAEKFLSDLSDELNATFLEMKNGKSYSDQELREEFDF